MNQDNKSTKPRRGPLGWFDAMARVFRRENALVLSDMGVLLFFVLLPLAYPVIYTLIYNPEVVRDMPVAVIDNSRTPASRRLVQTVDATPAVSVFAQCANMAEAKDLFGKNEVFAIMEIPANYEKQITNGQQATVTMYYEMSLLLRYRTFTSAMADVQLKVAQDVTAARINAVGMESLSAGGGAMPARAENTFLGDFGQGFASFIMPGVLILVLQQSMVLGICMLRGTSNERRRRNGGIDPREVQDAPLSAKLLGRALCYFVLYIPMCLFVVLWVPEIFSLPHMGNPADYLLMLVPFLLASAMFGQFVAGFCTERESAFIVVVFTSLVFLFISGLTWPTYAMDTFWKWVSGLIPTTWGVNAFVRINSNGATLADVAPCYHMLWILATAYFLLTWGVQAIASRTSKR